MNYLAWLFAIAIAAFFAGPALGCPVCDTATGEQVRAGIVDDHFGFNLFATLLPFPFLIGIVAFIHYGGRRPKP